MSIGKAWAWELEAHETQTRPADPNALAADAIISILKLIERARSNKQPSTSAVRSWLTASCVAGTDENRLQALATPSPSGDRRALRCDDLTGDIRLIVDWCERNDLEAFLQTTYYPFSVTDYSLHVRPKRG